MFAWMMFQTIIESLPVSSSGHVVLLERVYQTLGYNWCNYGENIDFLFHISAFVIMLVYFFQTWSMMILSKKLELTDLIKFSTYQKIAQPFVMILIVDLITFAFWKSDIAHHLYIQKFFLPIGFSLTAIMLYLTKNSTTQKSNHTLSVKDATVLGITQGLALLPGISRFASTFFVLRALGYNLKNSFALSFLIQFPLVCAAIFYAAFKMQHATTIFTEIFNLPMLFGMVAMTYVSYKIFCMVGTMIEENKIWYFSWYMIIPIVLSVVV